MNLFKSLATPFLLVAFILTIVAANAAQDNEKAEGADKVSLHAKLEPITVNLLGPTRQYIQVEITLKLAKPEADEKVKLYMPVIRHQMILLLTSKDANQLGPIAGKQQLVQESKRAINQALGLTEKEGVTDVLFSSFIIQ